jgi:site-specific DNA-methyltransferase (adenine-specific)
MVNESNIKEFRYELIWEKSQKAKLYSSEKEFIPTHENISVFYEKLGVCNPQVLGTKSKPIYPNSILTFDEVKKGKHPAQKPADLLEYLIKTYSNEDDIVLDCTMGSGSTGIACVKLNRNFIGIESSDKYFKIAEKEIQ